MFWVLTVSPKDLVSFEAKVTMLFTIILVMATLQSLDNAK